MRNSTDVENSGPTKEQIAMLRDLMPVISVASLIERWTVKMAAVHLKTIDEKTLRRRIKESDVWRRYFWAEGTHWLTSPGLLFLLQMELARISNEA